MRSAVQNMRNKKLYLYMKIQLQWDDIYIYLQQSTARTLEISHIKTLCGHNTKFLDVTAGS
jgi:hypothetical protein